MLPKASHDRASYLFYALVTIAFTFFISYRLVLVFYPTPDIGGIENNVIYFIQRILNDQTLYTDPERVPYSIAQYTPAYYYLVAFMAKLASINVDQVEKLFIVNRLVSLTLNLALVAVIIRLLKKVFNLKISYCIVAGLLTFIFTDGDFCRPDSLSAFCWIVSVYFLLTFLKKDAPEKYDWRLIAATFLGTLAMLAKQSALTILVISFFYLLKEKKLKAAFIYSLCSVLFLLVFSVLTFFIWDIHSFYRNIVTGLNNGIALGKFWDKFVLNFYNGHGFLFLVGIFIVGYQALWKKERSQCFRFIGFALLLEFLLSNVAAIKYGSGPNYFIMWIALLFIGLAVLADEIKDVLNIIVPRLGLVVVYLSILLRMASFIHPLILKLQKENYAHGKDLLASERELAKFISAQPEIKQGGLIFNNLFSPDSYLNNFLFRNAIIPQYDIVVACTYSRGVFNYADLKNKIHQGLVSFMITKGRDQPRFFDVDLHQFKLFAQMGDYRIYEWVG